MLCNDILFKEEGYWSMMVDFRGIDTLNLCLGFNSSTLEPKIKQNGHGYRKTN